MRGYFRKESQPSLTGYPLLRRGVEGGKRGIRGGKTGGKVVIKERSSVGKKRKMRKEPQGEEDVLFYSVHSNVKGGNLPGGTFESCG